LDKQAVKDWLEKYVQSWRTYDPQEISDLFTEDATYKYQPWGDPVEGRDAIIANWLESPDAPDSWRAEYEPYAVEGDRAVTIGWTYYFAPDGETVDRSYYNVWLLRFDSNGRCSEFVEVYMEPPKNQE
jgi:ketosteroid isomerase-like protein